MDDRLIRIEQERDKLRPHTIPYIILTCFLTQPLLVGPSADHLRRLDFDSMNDKAIFAASVAKAYELVTERLYGRDKDLARHIYAEGWQLFDGAALCNRPTCPLGK